MYAEDFNRLYDAFCELCSNILKIDSPPNKAELDGLFKVGFLDANDFYSKLYGDHIYKIAFELLKHKMAADLETRIITEETLHYMMCLPERVWPLVCVATTQILLPLSIDPNRTHEKLVHTIGLLDSLKQQILQNPSFIRLDRMLAEKLIDNLIADLSIEIYKIQTGIIPHNCSSIFDDFDQMHQLYVATIDPEYISGTINKVIEYIRKLIKAATAPEAVGIVSALDLEQDCSPANTELCSDANNELKEYIANLYELARNNLFIAMDIFDSEADNKFIHKYASFVVKTSRKKSYKNNRQQMRRLFKNMLGNAEGFLQEFRRFFVSHERRSSLCLLELKEVTYRLGLALNSNDKVFANLSADDKETAEYNVLLQTVHYPMLKFRDAIRQFYATGNGSIVRLFNNVNLNNDYQMLRETLLSETDPTIPSDIILAQLDAVVVKPKTKDILPQFTTIADRQSKQEKFRTLLCLDDNNSYDTRVLFIAILSLVYEEIYDEAFAATLNDVNLGDRALFARLHNGVFALCISGEDTSRRGGATSQELNKIHYANNVGTSEVVARVRSRPATPIFRF